MGRGGSILFWVVVAGTASWPVRAVVSYAWSAWQSSRRRASAFELVAHGLCSIFHDMGPWTPSDLILGVSALAKITEKEPPYIPGRRLDDLAQDPCFLVEAQGKIFRNLEMLRPAYIVAIDPAFGAIVLAVRGTRDIVDVLVDLAASPFFFSGSWCHRGFTHSATALLEDVRGYLLKALEDYPSFQVVCIGHSLGGGVATFSALLLREEKIDARCWAFSPPACVDEQLASLCASFTTSILCNHDLIPRFSAASVEQLREEICRFDWDKVQELAQSDDSWRMLANVASSMKRLQNLYLEASRRVQGLEKHRYDLPLEGLGTAFLQRESKNGRYLESKTKENMKVVQLFPPGRLIVLSCMPAGIGVSPVIRFGAPFIRRYGVAPTYAETYNITWSMSEARIEDFQKIIVSQWCLSDHMLSTIGIALDSLQRKAPSFVSLLRKHRIVD